VVAAAPQSASVLETLDDITDGAGADHVFLAASTSSNEPTESAAAFARDRGRIIDVGNTRLDLPWKDYYEKELDVRFSRSYGPGRYDPTYEEGGIDYPIGYVRWTERRNMKAFLELMGDKRVDVTSLIGETASFQDAVDVYTRIHEGSLDAVGVLFTYPEATESPDRVLEAPSRPAPETPLTPTAPRFGCIGAGNYASSMLLPHLAERGDVEMTAVATATALSAANAHSRFGFRRMTTDAAAVLDDPDVTCFMILTRHDSHAYYVTEALRKQKPVYVEKPLALDREELESVVATAFESQNHQLLVGYNRRFSPLLGDLRSGWGETGPVQVSYQVNAGRLAEGSWYADRGAQGSRFVGEGGHFIDTISWWIGADPETVMAVAGGVDPDDLQVLLTYPDGSVGHIAYLTQGDPRFPKERMTVSGGGQIALMDNFSSGQLWRSGKKQRVGNLRRTDKGQSAEMAALVRLLKQGGVLPIPFDSLIATSAATMAAVESARIGTPVPVADFIPTAPSTGEFGD
jgi:predicted dehydrogenase